MVLSEETRQKILEEGHKWIDNYAGNSKSERQDMGQFFTPPEIALMLLETLKKDTIEGTVLDPTCGGGALLAAAILAGADPKKCYGVELDQDILKVAKSRLEPMGVPPENLHHGNALNMDCFEFSPDYHYDMETDTVTHGGKKKFKFGI